VGQAWRQKRAHGDVIRGALRDDIVVGFHSKADAEQFRAELRNECESSTWKLHPRENANCEFGPFAIDQTGVAWRGKTGDVQLLGFTHICVKRRSNGRFLGAAANVRKRLQKKLNEVKPNFSDACTNPSPKWQVVASGGAWTHPVLRWASEPQRAVGFSIPVGRLWHRALSRRSQNGRVLWDRQCGASSLGLVASATVCHPYPCADGRPSPKARADAGIPLVGSVEGL